MSLALVAHGRTVAGFNKDTGLLSVLRNAESGLEYLRGAPQPVFAIVLRTGEGKELRYTAADAATAHVEASAEGLRVWYNFLGGANLCATCTVGPGDCTALSFGISIRNRTGHRLVSIEYPLLLLPRALEGPASDWAMASGAMTNGTVFHGFENAFTSPRMPFEGSFAEPLQLAAFGTRSESVYMCTMDARHHAKNIQPLWDGTHLKVSSTHYFDEPDQTRFTLPYPCGLEILADGSWCASAEKYREWAETQEWTARKLAERPDVPKWWLQSPIVLSIKERGKRNSDMGQRTSPWCHPLEKGVPRILDLARRLESTFKVQVFHWEHGGAFINGEHFPPLSGFDGVKRFLDLLHEKGHYGGFYILPLKWCLHGYSTGYDGSRWFEEHDAMGNACVDDQGRPITSSYDWAWRKRFHMCGGAPVTRSEIIESFRKLADAGADYLQLDTFSGRLYDCWSHEHGHTPGPGRWQNDLAVSLIREIQAASRPFVFTVEGEPTEALLQLGHGFVERGLHPVRSKGWEMIPLFQFVYHQYAQGFCGENCGSWNTPDNFYFLSAITVASGDMLMVNLSEEGKIAMQTHEIDDYDQTIESVYPPEQTEKFLRDLNRLRRECAREFLVLGRMERPPQISAAIATILEGDDLHPSNADGHWKPSAVSDFHVVVPAVIGSSWTSPEGKSGTVLINHTTAPQKAEVRLRSAAGGAVEVQWDSGRREKARLTEGVLEIEMPALSSLVIRP